MEKKKTFWFYDKKNIERSKEKFKSILGIVLTKIL